MKYALFGYDYYYPCGGMNDLIKTFYSIDDIDFDNIDVDCAVYQIVNLYIMKQENLELRNIIEEDGDADYLSPEDEETLRKNYLRHFVSDFIKGEEQYG